MAKQKLDETVCDLCGDEYSLRNGDEPTKYCDHCAHKRVEELEPKNQELREALKRLAWTTAGVLAQISGSGPTEMIAAVFDGRELQLAQDAVKQAEQLLK